MRYINLRLLTYLLTYLWNIIALVASSAADRIQGAGNCLRQGVPTRLTDKICIQTHS